MTPRRRNHNHKDNGYVREVNNNNFSCATPLQTMRPKTANSRQSIY